MRSRRVHHLTLTLTLTLTLARHACRICFVNQTAACRRPADAVAAAAPGTLDANFERLASGPAAARVLSREPWVLAFDGFLSSAEADAIVRASGHNFEASHSATPQ